MEICMFFCVCLYVCIYMFCKHKINAMSLIIIAHKYVYVNYYSAVLL